MSISFRLRLLMAACVLLVSTPCFAQQLWRGTAKGMTPAQVRSIVDAATDVGVPDHMRSGALGLLRVPEVVIGSQKFSATFYFLGGSLDEVQLERAEPMSPYEASLHFDELAAALTGKYGAPIAQKEEPGELMSIRTREWMSGRTNVQLMLMVIGKDDHDPELNITYQTRLASEGDNL